LTGHGIDCHGFAGIATSASQAASAAQAFFLGSFDTPSADEITGAVSREVDPPIVAVVGTCFKFPGIDAAKPAEDV